jgi:hypothetical protein
MPVVVGGTCRRAARHSAYGTRVPSTTTHATPAHTGITKASSTPRSDVASANGAASKDHHGWATAQQRPEGEHVERQRSRIAGRGSAFTDEQVGGQARGGAESGGNAERVKTRVAPYLGDQGESAEGQTGGEPGPRLNLFATHHPGVHRYESRCGELQQQRDTHRKAVDRDEVQPLDHRRAGNPQHDQGRQLPGGKSKPAGCHGKQNQPET